MAQWNFVCSCVATSDKKIVFETSTLSPWAFRKVGVEDKWKENIKATWSDANLEGWDGSNYKVYSFTKSIVTSSTYNIPAMINGVTISTVTNLRSMAWGEIGGKGITHIGSWAFEDCKSLVNVSFPSCSIVSDYAFKGCGLSKIELPLCSDIRSYAFLSCTSLTTVSFPVCISISDSCFKEDSSLQSVTMPMLKQVPQQAFSDCTSLKEIELPSCSYIGYGAFYRCGNLSVVSLPICNSIAQSAFEFCSSVMSLYLLSNSVVSLGYFFPFSRSYPPTVYVPSSLVDSYKSANVWSDFASKIVAYQG